MNGQAKIDFEKWVFKNYKQYSGNYHNRKLSIFTDLTPQMTNALIIEWFDSIGIIITINYWTEASYTISNKNGGKDLYSGLCGKTRQEATEKAIEKAVEIYNNLK